MLSHDMRDYKYPSFRCRVDPNFRTEFFKKMQVFYRFTDGIFNCIYLGKIFKVSAKYARQVILECPICAEINHRRRYRRKYQGIKLFQLKQLVVLSWKKAPENVFIDDLAVMWNIPVVSAQTYLNKRVGASEDERTLKRPLSFNSPDEFYERNGWVDDLGNWTPSTKTIGWMLSPELQAQSRTFDEYPWANPRVIQAVGKAFTAGTSTEEIMRTYNIPDIRTFRHYVSIYTSQMLNQLKGTNSIDRSMKFMPQVNKP